MKSLTDIYRVLQHFLQRIKIMNSHSMPVIDREISTFYIMFKNGTKIGQVDGNFSFLTTFLSEVVIDNILQNIYSKILKCKPGCDIE